MSFLLRNVLPFTYFQFSRLNNVKHLVYHFLLEWLPAPIIALYYNNFDTSVLVTFFITYLAFISIYEIGYLTNDFFSEKFESTPRGRMADLSVSQTTVYILIFVRLIAFVFFTFILNAQNNGYWWIFFAMMLLTFTIHNIRIKSFRISSFFSLSFFRFTAPLILVLPLNILNMLFPVVMLYYSLFRTIAYIENRNGNSAPNKSETSLKIIYFINAFPLGIVLAISYNSFLPIIFCLYYICIWFFYGTVLKMRFFDIYLVEPKKCSEGKSISENPVRTI